MLYVLCAIAVCGAAFFMHQYVSSSATRTGSLSPQDRYSAFREQWRTAILQEGSKESYEQMVSQAEAVAKDKKIDTHTQAHLFGEVLYEVEGLDGIGTCDDRLRFGCYHSFFGLAIYEQGVEILPTLDEICRGLYGPTDTRCQHGIGHGALVYTGYENLLEALQLCQTIVWYPTGGCSGGVFMEYNFHTMESTDTETYVRPLGENPYEPCDTLPKEFQASCYLEQVQWWEAVFDGDFTHIATLCQTLPKTHEIYNSCFHGIGTHLTEHVDFDFEEIVAECATMPSKETQQLCLEGSSWLVASPEYYELYMNLCGELQGAVQARCYDTAPESVTST